MKAPSAALVIFAKAPIPGQVKTRLCPPLTPDEAAGLHGSLVQDVLERSGVAAKGSGSSTFDRVLACSPVSNHVFFKIMEERQGVRLISQVGDDLGDRMSNAFRSVFAWGYERVLLVGTDLPSLSEASYAKAVDLLSDHDLVLGPSLDGGYYLIGLRSPAPDLFVGISWSTDQVFATTTAKAEALKLKTALLPPCRDVDTIEDLKALIMEVRLEAGGKGRRAKPGGADKTQPLTSRPALRAHTLSKRTAGVLRLLADRHADLED